MNRVRASWIPILFMLLIGLLAPPSAQAGPARFTVDYCDSALPGGNPPEFAFNKPEGYGLVQTCASPGGVLGISELGLVYDNQAAAMIVTIPVTRGGYIEDETISGYVSNLQPGNSGYIFYAGWPLSGGGDTARKFILHESPLFGGSVEVWGGDFPMVMGCSNNPCNGGGTIAAHYIAATQVDPIPPVISKVEGSLLSGGVLRGHQSLSALAGDTGGGVSRVEVLVNGLPAAPAAPGACAIARVSNSSYQGLAATSPSPCPASMPASWLIDTASYPFHDGDNTVQVCASDLAAVGSPNTTCSEVKTARIDNKCVNSTVGGGQVLSANFAPSSSETVLVPFGQPAEVKGELNNNAGDPIPGATICVQAQTEDESGDLVPVATTTTDANGQFTYQVPPGPNRHLLIGYRHDAFQVGHTISYSAHSKPTLKLRPGRVNAGGRIAITGSLPGPAAAGRVIVLQASALHGKRWLTFRRATTGPKGGFRAAYHFGRRTSSTITYRIRAVVPLQSGYPYAAGHSTPALVKVRAGGRRHRHKRAAETRADGRPIIEVVRDQGTSSERVGNQTLTEDRIRRTK